MFLLSKIKSVLFEPDKFFTNLRKEKGIKDAFVYFAILSAVNTALAAIAAHLGFIYLPNIFNMPDLYQITNSGPKPVFGLFVGFYLLWLIVNFAIAGLIHLWIKLMGGKEGYTKTYQFYAYSRTPDLLLGWIPFIGVLSWFYDLALIIIGTQKVHGIDRRKAYLMFALPALVLVLLVFILILLLGFLLAGLIL